MLPGGLIVSGRTVVHFLEYGPNGDGVPGDAVGMKLVYCMRCREPLLVSDGAYITMERARAAGVTPVGAACHECAVALLPPTAQMAMSEYASRELRERPELIGNILAQVAAVRKKGGGQG